MSLVSYATLHRNLDSKVYKFGKADLRSVWPWVSLTGTTYFSWILKYVIWYVMKFNTKLKYRAVIIQGRVSPSRKRKKSRPRGRVSYNTFICTINNIKRAPNVSFVRLISWSFKKHVKILLYNSLVWKHNRVLEPSFRDTLTKIGTATKKVLINVA